MRNPEHWQKQVQILTEKVGCKILQFILKGLLNNIFHSNNAVGSERGTLI